MDKATPNFEAFEEYLKGFLKEFALLRATVTDKNVSVQARGQAITRVCDFQFVLVGSLETIYRMFGEEAYTYYATFAEELLSEDE